MRPSLKLVAGLATAVLLVSAHPANAAPPSDRVQTEWREVFSPDGTITRVRMPKQIDPPLDASTRAAAAAVDVVPLQQTGPTSERYDLVFVGDGYTSSQMSLFHQHVASKWAEISTVEPFKKYKNYFNVWMVNVISAQSGVDNDPRGTLRNTALDMKFWCNNTERLLCVNTTKARSFANNAPAVDHVLALANSTKYGGAGGSIATASGGNAQSGQIAIHELGHSIGGLADEYDYPNGTYTGPEPSAVNVSKYTSAQMTSMRVKWYSYLGQSTPDGGVMGTFEGAHYHLRGIYRPSQNSLMRSLGRPFNLVGLDVMDRAIRAKIVMSGSGCTGYPDTYSGSLANGGSAIQPNDTYYQSTTAGAHQACLDGPDGTNFNLHLQRWNGSSWADVASGATTGSDEAINYSGAAGYYQYRVVSVSGSGAYTLGLRRPS